MRQSTGLSKYEKKNSKGMAIKPKLRCLVTKPCILFSSGGSFQLVYLLGMCVVYRYQ